MFQSAVRLIAFAHVAVLCVCMGTNVTVSSTVRPTNNSLTPSPSPSNTTGSASISPGDTHTGDKRNNETNPDAVNSTVTQTPHGTTNTSGQENVQPVITHTKESPKITTAKALIPKAVVPKAATTKAATTKAATSGDTQSSTGKGAGIFFLLFILLIIIILAFVLYVLWKKGKKYSFDLNNGEHDTPLRSMEHAGTFEPTKGSTMNLEYVKDETTNKSSPVANGCSGETPDQTASSEQQNVPEEDSFSSDLSLDLPVKKVEFNLDLELIGADPEPAKEDTVETTDNDNENNNNDMNA
ncbi:flocculation FLO11-like isoform X1, partial [Clarias magur]